MKDTIVALVPSVLLFVGTVITVIATSRNTRAEMKINYDKTISHIEQQNENLKERVNDLATKVEKHNNFDGRIIALETEVNFIKGMFNDGK